MAIKSKQISLLIIFIPILALLGVGIYTSFINSEKYFKSVDFKEKLQKIDRLEKLEKSIFDEVLCISKLNIKDENTRESCQNIRNVSDEILLNSNTANKNSISYIEQVLKPLRFSVNKESTSSELLDTQKMQLVLKQIRYDIDISDTITVDTLLFGDYSEKIINPIRTVIKGISANKETAQEKILYNQLKNIYDHANLERILVSHYLVNKFVIPKSILSTWDTYIATLSLFDPDDLEQMGKMGKSLIKIFDNKTYYESKEKIDEARIDIISNYQTGNYEYKIDKWIDLTNIQDEIFLKANKFILSSVYDDVNKEVQNTGRMLLIGIGLVIFSLLFILFLIKYYFKVREEDKVLEKVIAGIEQLSLSEVEGHVAIPQMPKNLANKTEVYHYLDGILHLLHAKEIEAAEANEAKTQFLANMSHEIRTPLNGIVGFTQILKDTELNEDQNEFISIIQTSSDNLLSIVNDILDISKINAKKMDIENISFNLSDKMESVVELLITKAEQKDISLGIYIDPSLTMKRLGDSVKISQIMTNLIGNAIKFTPSYGSISVYVERADEDNILFKVVDTGIGISAENKNKIFEAFSQADNSTSREYGGTGLGLTISSEMIHLMGGELKFDSIENEGSTFFFEIPLKEDEEEIAHSVNYYDNVSVGLALPTKDLKREIDVNLAKYFEYLKVDFKIYYYEDIFNKGGNIQLPKHMIFDHQYARKDDDFENIVSLDCSISMISTGTLNNRIDHEKYTFNSIVLAPMTLKKTIKILDSIGKEKVQLPQSKAVIEKEEKEVIFGDLLVLVAEDNPINQKLIKVVLNNFGLDVEVAPNGKEAVEMRKEGNYDIIFMDIQMPIMNGMEATVAILEYEKSEDVKHIPIVALTANALVGDREKYLAIGMDDYLSKPLNADKLNGILEKYLSSKKIEIETNILEIPEMIKDNEDDEKVISKEVSAPEIVAPTPIIVPTIEYKADILLLHTIPIVANVYMKKLSNLKYNIDVVTDPDEFLNNLDKYKYKFAMYNVKPFENAICMITDIIRDSGAKPLTLVSDQEEDIDYGAERLRLDADNDEVDEKLKSIS